MKKKKKKLSMSLSAIIVCFLVSTSSPNALGVNALLEEKGNQYTLDSFDNSTWKWTTTEVVSTESTGASDYPSLAVDTLGNVHVAWYDYTDYAGAGTDWDIFYKRWDASTSSWTTTEVVSTQSTENSYNPSLAVDTLGNVHVTWWDVTDYAGSATDQDIFYKRWDASTSSWTTTEVVSTESTAPSIYPSLTVDSADNAHIAWEDYTDYAGAGGTELDIFYKRWNASTSLWTMTEVVSTESTDGSYRPSLAVDSTMNVHVAWYDATVYAEAGADQDIFYKRWEALTSSWTTTEIVSTESTGDSQYPSLAVDTLGNVHIAWHDLTDYAGSGTDPDIFYNRWDTSTSLWIITEIVSTDSTSSSAYPSLAVDTIGNVHVAWQDWTDYAGAGSDDDIFFKSWYTSASSWTITEVVSTESTLDSYWSSHIVDSMGTVHVAWQDVTDYAGAGTDWDIFYKFAVPILPEAPELAFIVPNPTDIETIYLDWDNISGASSYYVYRHTYYIWSVEYLFPIASVSESAFFDTLPSEGYFYYVIVAGNIIENSTHSNCQYVEYRIPHVREFSIISSLILSAFVISLVIVKKRKTKLK